MSDASTNKELHGSAKKEAFHEAAEAGVHTFTFAVPDGIPDGAKGHVRLAGTDTVRVSVQILRNGGENNLHYHPNVELVYMVLKGKVRFYGPGDALLGELGPHQGILLPENARYWFASVGSEEAWLLQIAGYPRGAKTAKRVAVKPRTTNKHGVWFDQPEDERERRDVRHTDEELRGKVKPRQAV
jgi:oxalate decarboxylase/phosphoglucose isomerase-like protein (cupin superfamily)